MRHDGAGRVILTGREVQALAAALAVHDLHVPVPRADLGFSPAQIVVTGIAARLSERIGGAVLRDVSFLLGFGGAEIAVDRPGSIKIGRLARAHERKSGSVPFSFRFRDLDDEGFPRFTTGDNIKWLDGPEMNGLVAGLAATIDGHVRAAFGALLSEQSGVDVTVLRLDMHIDAHGGAFDVARTRRRHRLFGDAEREPAPYAPEVAAALLDGDPRPITPTIDPAPLEPAVDEEPVIRLTLDPIEPPEPTPVAEPLPSPGEGRLRERLLDLAVRLGRYDTADRAGREPDATVDAEGLRVFLAGALEVGATVLADADYDGVPCRYLVIAPDGQTAIAVVSAAAGLLRVDARRAIGQAVVIEAISSARSIEESDL